MNRSALSPYIPVAVIALGVVAIAAGAVMVAMRERERQVRGISDDPLEDTAEVDIPAEEICAANEAGSVLTGDPIEGISAGIAAENAMAERADRAGRLGDAPERGVWVETVPNGIVVHADEEHAAGEPRPVPGA